MAPAAGGAPSVRGNVLAGRLAYLRSRGGEPLLQQVLARLDTRDRSALGGMILGIAWFPLELSVRLDNAIADVLSPNNRPQAMIDLGRASAEDALTGPQKVFVRAGDPHYLLEHTPQIYRLYYTVGTRTYEKTGPTSAVLRTRDAEAVTASDCLTIVGWHARAIELSGGSEVKVDEPVCRARGGDHCQYRCSWK